MGSSDQEVGRYRIDRELEDGLLEAFDLRLRRAVVLSPYPPEDIAANTLHNTVDIGGQRFFVTGSDPAAESPMSHRWRGLVGIAAAVAACALALLTWWLAAGRWDHDPLYVAVPPCEAPSNDAGDSVSAVRLAVEHGAINALGSLEGVLVISGSSLPSSASSPEALARAVAADAVLVFAVLDRGRERPTVLARLLDRKGDAIWTDAFSVPADNPGLAAAAARSNVLEHLKHRHHRPGTGAYVDPADVAAYLEIRDSLRRGGHSMAASLEKIAAIRASSPGLVEAAALEVSVACYLYRTTGTEAYLDQARSALAQSPAHLDDPRLAAAAVELALAASDADQVWATIGHLGALAPGHPMLPRSIARARELEGDRSAAIRGLKEATASRRTWYDLVALADLEWREGRWEEARATLGEAHRLAPEQAAVIAKLANLELINGSPQEAEQLLLHASARSSRPIYAENLGLAMLLQGRYEEAKERFEWATALGSRLPLVSVLKADALVLMGDRQAALKLYGEALAAYESAPDDLEAGDLAEMAYCRARLGERASAEAAISAALADAGEDPDVRFYAWLVYRLAGDEPMAEAQATAARRAGLSDSWFQLPLVGPGQASPRHNR
jgi:tetratricopeptide (TPR) repeat protein